LTSRRSPGRAYHCFSDACSGFSFSKPIPDIYVDFDFDSTAAWMSGHATKYKGIITSLAAMAKLTFELDLDNGRKVFTN
jgi:hypothetical protein